MFLPSIRFYLNPRYIMDRRQEGARWPLPDEESQRFDVTTADAMRRLGASQRGFETRLVRCHRCGLGYRYGQGHLDSAFCHGVYQAALAYKAGLFPLNFPSKRFLEKLSIPFELRYTRGVLTGGEPAFRGVARLEWRLWVRNDIALTLWRSDNQDEIKTALKSGQLYSLSSLPEGHFWAPDVVDHFNAWETPHEEVPVHLRWPRMNAEAA